MTGSRGTRLAPDLPPGPRTALIVATTSYQDPELRQLRAPAHDAEDLAGVLGDPRIGAFTVIRVMDQDERRVRREIDTFLSGRGVSDLVVVYLSCHGVLDRRGRLYFAAADTVKTQLGSTGIPAAWLLDQLDECHARRQVLILDCCFSGAFAHGSKGDEGLELERRLAGRGRGRAVLTASRAGEYSFEGQALPDAAVAGSVFTAGLVEGLRTGAADVGRDGYVSLDEAYDYAYEYVQSSGAGQTPQRWLYGAEGAILLARSPAGVAVTPAPLPEALAASLDSPYPAVRIGGVETLHEWLTSGDPARALTAAQKLRQIADTDVPAVAAAARSGLASLQPADPARGFDEHGPAPELPRQPPPSRSARALSCPQRLADTLTLRRSAGWFILAVAFSPDGHVLASSSNGARIQLWDPSSGKEARTLAVDVGRFRSLLFGAISSVAFSPDGQLLASATFVNTVLLWDPATGQQLRGLTEPGLIGSVAFSHDGQLLASACHDGAIRLWDPSAGLQLRALTGHTAPVNSVAFSPDGRLLASASEDGTVRLWDPSAGQSLRTLVGRIEDETLPLQDLSADRPLRPSTNVRVINSVAFSPDGELLASSGNDARIHLWDPSTGQRLRTLAGHDDGIRSVVFSPDGQLLASAGNDKTVKLWDPAVGQQLRTLTGHTAAVRSVAFSPDGQLLASGGEDRTVRLWR